MCTVKTRKLCKRVIYDFDYVNIRQSNCAVYTFPFLFISLLFKLLVKLFALLQHQIHLKITLMPFSYSTVFWFSLYKQYTLV